VDGGEHKCEVKTGIISSLQWHFGKKNYHFFEVFYFGCCGRYEVGIWDRILGYGPKY